MSPNGQRDVDFRADASGGMSSELQKNPTGPCRLRNGRAPAPGVPRKQAASAMTSPARHPNREPIEADPRVASMPQDAGRYKPRGFLFPATVKRGEEALTCWGMLVPRPGGSTSARGGAIHIRRRTKEVARPACARPRSLAASASAAPAAQGRPKTPRAAPQRGRPMAGQPAHPGSQWATPNPTHSTNHSSSRLQPLRARRCPPCTSFAC